jgi:hypothetical protein
MGSVSDWLDHEESRVQIGGLLRPATGTFVS